MNRDFSNSKMMPVFLVFVSMLAASYTGAEKAELSVFPERYSGISLTKLDYSQVLHAGTQNDTFFMRGRFGVDVPLAAASFDTRTDRYSAGLIASVNLNMIPRNMKFAVDNFYAALGIYIEGYQTEWLSFRLYPVYHLSAHLADGHKGSAGFQRVEAVSSEMILAEVSFLPLGNLETRTSYGYYYHTVAQNGLTQRFEIAALYRLFRVAFLEPFLSIRSEWISLGRWNSGVDLSSGTLVFVDNRYVFALNFRYFDHSHPGYYFRERENGFGIECQFLY